MTTEAGAGSGPRPVGLGGRDLGLQDQAGRGLEAHAVEEGRKLVVIPRNLGAHPLDSQRPEVEQELLEDRAGDAAAFA